MRAERRLVSVLFADLVGFTTLLEHRDPEEVRELLSRYFDRCRTLIERFGGTVEKFIGDAVTSMWGSLVAREDDAERAVRAAISLTNAVTVLGEEVGRPELRARAGVLTGNAAVDVGAEREGMVLGDTVNAASRLQSIAAPGAVLVDGVTRRASEAAIKYEDTGAHEVKGREQPIHAWTALRVVAGVGGARRGAGLEAPFVGRERELQTIVDIAGDSIARRTARLVTVTGEAGAGKSRLLWEFFKHMDGIEEVRWWHQGRCLSYGEGVSYCMGLKPCGCCLTVACSPRKGAGTSSPATSRTWRCPRRSRRLWRLGLTTWRPASGHCCKTPRWWVARLPPVPSRPCLSSGKRMCASCSTRSWPSRCSAVTTTRGRQSRGNTTSYRTFCGRSRYPRCRAGTARPAIWQLPATSSRPGVRTRVTSPRFWPAITLTLSPLSQKLPMCPPSVAGRETLVAGARRASALALGTEAGTLFQRAAALSETETDRAVTLAEAGAAAARSDRESGSKLLEEAIIGLSRLEQASELLAVAEPALRDPAHIAEVAARRGHVAFLLGDYELTRSQSELALSIADPRRLAPVIGEAAMNKAVALDYDGRESDGRESEAGALMTLVLGIAVSADLPEIALRAYFNLADYHCLMANLDEAVNHIDRGLALARERGSRAWERDLIGQSVQIDLIRGEWDRALAATRSLDGQEPRRAAASPSRLSR